jgi:hypothetical protein
MELNVSYDEKQVEEEEKKSKGANSVSPRFEGVIIKRRESKSLPDFKNSLAH